jgi:protein arginine N-methyltransferase 1
MAEPSSAAKTGSAPDPTDFANYFCTYGFLYHQKDMLEDHKRTGAYYQAVMSNKRQFAGKVVLDVGTGSGILAIFAAKAGARKVYAVEATGIAASARKLIEHNKVGAYHLRGFSTFGVEGPTCSLII